MRILLYIHGVTDNVLQHTLHLDAELQSAIATSNLLQFSVPSGIYRVVIYFSLSLILRPSSLSPAIPTIFPSICFLFLLQRMLHPDALWMHRTFRMMHDTRLTPIICYRDCWRDAKERIVGVFQRSTSITINGTPNIAEVFRVSSIFPLRRIISTICLRFSHLSHRQCDSLLFSSHPMNGRESILFAVTVIWRDVGLKCSKVRKY